MVEGLSACVCVYVILCVCEHACMRPVVYACDAAYNARVNMYGAYVCMHVCVFVCLSENMCVCVTYVCMCVHIMHM